MSSPDILPFRAAPCTVAVEPQGDTLGAAVNRYLDHLSLQLQLGELGREHYAGKSRFLQRFVEAWRVVFADGRQSLLAAASPTPRPGKPRGPARPTTAAEAITAASRLLAGASSVGAQAVRNGDWPLARASGDDLMRWILANPQWLSGDAKANAIAAIVGCFAWWEDESGARNPFRRRRAPKFEKGSRREAAPEEYDALAGEGSSLPFRRALWCLHNVSGIRTCEVYDLRWTDFKWAGPEKSAIVLTRHKSFRKTKKPKIIGLTPASFAFFRMLLAERIPEAGDHVFLNSKGTPWDRHTFARHLRRRAFRLGLDAGVEKRVSAYCLRHSFATDAEEAGVPLAQAGMLMGHVVDDRGSRSDGDAGRPRMTAHYSKADQKVEHVCRVAREVEAKVEAHRKAKRPRKSSEVQLELF